VGLWLEVRLEWDELWSLAGDDRQRVQLMGIESFASTIAPGEDAAGGNLERVSFESLGAPVPQLGVASWLLVHQFAVMRIIHKLATNVASL